jgi:hypothetical protein
MYAKEINELLIFCSTVFIEFLVKLTINAMILAVNATYTERAMDFEDDPSPMYQFYLVN